VVEADFGREDQMIRQDLALPTHMFYMAMSASRSKRPAVVVSHPHLVWSYQANELAARPGAHAHARANANANA